MAKDISSNNLKQQFQNNKQLRIITFSIGGVILLLVGYLIYRQFVFGPKNEKSKEAYVTGLNYASQDSTDMAIQELEPVVKKYDGTVGGENAQLVLARQYMEKGNFKKALDLLEDVDVNDTYLQVGVIGLQGDCYSEMGKYEEAMNKYEEAAETNENEKTSPEYLFKAALVAEHLKDFEKATELYTQIRDNYAMFSQQKAIEKYIKRSENKKIK
jgi:predicted negative regulator of RcsB-dependent stress response